MMNKTTLQNPNNSNRSLLRKKPWLHIACHPKQRFGGYPGLALTALQISEYIPRCNTFIEPFAGLGRISKRVNAKQYVLNDKSEFALNYLKNHFTARIMSIDFADCIRLYADNPDAFFFIDPPWHQDIYQENPKSYCDREPLSYYKKIFQLLPSIKGDWMLCSDYREAKIKKMLSNSGYPMKVFTSRKKFLGNYAKTRVISNKPFVRYHQDTLF